MVNVILSMSHQLVRIQQAHRSDSNQSLVGSRGHDRRTGRIQIKVFPTLTFFLYLISDLLGQKFKILKVDSVENLCFELNQDLDDDHKQKEF